MTIIDPIADMLTRTRNALAVRKRHVLIPHSKLKLELARVLKEEGYIEGYNVSKHSPQPVIRMRLKYTKEHEPLVSGLRRVSKPGRRVYTRRDGIPLVLSGMGVAVLSTSRGIMTGKKAHRLGLGGEVLCHIW